VPLSYRDNYLRNVRMTGPEWMPVAVSISNASWDQWREAMEDVCLRHPSLFPGFAKGQRDYDHFDFGPAHRAGECYVDNWGVTWHSEVNGLEGCFTNCPLSDWSALETYRAPDPLVTGDRGPVDWEAIRQGAAAAKAAGHLTSGGLAHGFLLMRMYYLRGFENLMMDFATDEPRR
jgi:hypothetical protein